MKRKDMLAALKDRIQPLENSEAGLLCGGFTEIGDESILSDNNNIICSGNITCDSNTWCKHNTSCSNNKGCERNKDCTNKGTDSAGDEVLDYSTIF